MSRCKFDREAGEYLLSDGEPCRVDEEGNPTLHCQHRDSCSVHVGYGEQTCPRCVGRTRRDLRAVVTLAALMAPQAVARGVNSDAASYAGPAANPAEHQARRIERNRRDDYAYLSGRISGQTFAKLIVDEYANDEDHPANVLGIWEMMLREDYGQPEVERITVESAAAYLDGILGRVAQDSEQDFELMAKEVHACRERLELAVRNHRQVERGAKCPICEAQRGNAPKLVRKFGHWCTDEECEEIHYHDAEGDDWVCPHDKRHWWTHEDYTRWVADVYEPKGA